MERCSRDSVTKDVVGRRGGAVSAEEPSREESCGHVHLLPEIRESDPRPLGSQGCGRALSPSNCPLKSSSPITLEFVRDANSQPYLRPAESENQLRKIGNPPKVMQLVRGRAKMF